MNIGSKDKVRATIADLVAAGDTPNDDPGFFQPVPSADGNLQPGSHVSENVAVLDRLRSVNMLVPGSALGPVFSDEYRRIKRPLLSNAFGKTASLVDRGNLILVTSSVPGEGKTHTAVNLALSIAQERDHTVLLVDCDVTKQGASRMLGLESRPGLVDVLENDNMSIGEVLVRTDVPELCVLCSGKQHEYVTELLSSQRMAALVEEMASRYEDRVIIFDGPPMLASPQTQILAGLVGQIVFVIEAAKTSQSIVEEALELVPQDKATGLIMNKSEGMAGHGGYYYGYYNASSSEHKTRS